MNFTGQMRGRIDGEHAHAAFKPHAHVEELHVQLAVIKAVPQRMFRIVLNGVISLRRKRRQRIRQRTGRTAPGLFRQVMGHRLQHGKIKLGGAAVGDIRFGGESRAGKESGQCRSAAGCGESHRGLNKTSAVHA